MATTTTSQKVDKALEILKGQDWYWCMSDYTHPAYDYACGNMKAFVKLVATIAEKDIVKALRDLLKKAYDLSKEIEDEIEALITELYSRIDEQPKFDLSRTNTSISTNLSNE